MAEQVGHTQRSIKGSLDLHLRNVERDGKVLGVSAISRRVCHPRQSLPCKLTLPLLYTLLAKMRPVAMSTMSRSPVEEGES